MWSNYFRFILIKIKAEGSRRIFLFLPLYSMREIMECFSDLFVFISLIAPNLKIMYDKKDKKTMRAKDLMKIPREFFDQLSNYGSFELVSVETKDVDIKIEIK